MRIAIIGGGPGGLMSAHLIEERSRQSHRVTIFEATRRLGGKILTRRFGSEAVSYEAGVAELYDYSGIGPDPLRELIGSLGLPVVELKGGAVVIGGRIIEAPAALGREFGPDALKALRRSPRRARSAISPAEYYESDWEQDNADPLSKESFGDLLDRVPDPDARRYIEVAVHSDLATEPDQTSAMYGLQNFLMDEPDYMRLYAIEGGIGRLPRALAARIGATVRLEHAVDRVERTPTGEYRVTSRHQGERRSDDFDRVIVALPNNWIPAVEWGGEALGRAMRRHHSHYNHPAHYLRVSILFGRPFWREQIAGSYFMLDAFGGCCVYDESSRGPCGDRGVLGWLLAGEAALNLSNLDDDDLVGLVLDSLPGPLRHGRDSLLEAQVHRWVGTVNGLPGGYPLVSPEARHLPEPIGHPGLYVVGDYLYDSTLNGVLDSADLVADLILGRPQVISRADVARHPAGNDPSPSPAGPPPVPLEVLRTAW